MPFPILSLIVFIPLVCGALILLIPAGRKDWVRGLALAGDWTATDFPSTIGGAAQSAELATRVILDQAPVG